MSDEKKITIPCSRAVGKSTDLVKEPRYDYIIMSPDDWKDIVEYEELMKKAQQRVFASMMVPVELVFPHKKD